MITEDLGLFRRLEVGVLLSAWRELGLRWRALTLVLLVLDGVYYAAYDLSFLVAGLPAEAADRIFAILGAFFAPFHGAVIITMLAHWEQGRSFGPMDLLRAALKNWTRLFVVYFAVSLLFCGWLLIGAVPGLIAMALLGFENPYYLAPFAIPAIWIMTRYAFVDPACVLEGRMGSHARWRSRDLAEGRQFLILGIGLLTVLPASLLDMFAVHIASSLLETPEAAGMFGTTFFLQLMAAVFGMAAYVAYYRLYRRLVEGQDPPPHGVNVSDQRSKT